LTVHLDIQTRPSMGSNTSSLLWILCKSVQPFPIYLVHKQTNKQTNETYHRQR